MKFKLVDEYVVDRTVTVKVPGNGESFVEQKFTARFRVMDSDTAAAFHTRMEESERPETDRDLLREVFVAIVDGVVDDDGNPVPDSEAAREQMMRVPFVRIALLEAYAAVLKGGAGKN